MKNFKTRALVAATAATLGLGISGTARADAKAFSELLISNFTINHSNGTQYGVSDFTTITVGNAGTTTADLRGVPATSGTVPTTPGPVDPAQACVASGISGGCPGPGPNPNNFAQQTITPPFPLLQTNDFARADAQLTGAIITGTGAVGPATADQVAEVELDFTGNGVGHGGLTNGSQFTFSVAQADSITFNLTASGTLEVAFDAAAASGTSTAAFNFILDLRNLTTGALVTHFADPLLNASITLSPPSPPFPDHVTVSLLPTAFSFSSPTLIPGNVYSLTIQSDANANATVVEGVPEPATVALLGIGLVGVATGIRRRRVT